MISDPVIDELHAIKDQLSREANYSIAELFRQMRQESQNSGRKHVSFATPREQEQLPENTAARD